MRRKKLGSFYIVEHLGTGGMSQVYLALNPKTREKRAVKVLTKRATESPVVYARFLREVEIIRGLSHANIVKILESGSAEEFYYYAMEYMPGGNLSRKIGRGRLPVLEVMRLFAPICDAIAYAHDKGVIHRDLKPANILLDGAGVPMVSDFGIAKVIDGGNETLTRSGEIMGTIAYLAPEQRFNSKSVDKRADVYALGTILYEMIMGFPPLGKFPWPSEIQKDFPELLQAILERCLAFEPKDRYLHAGFLMSDVGKFQESLGEINICGHRGIASEKFDDQESLDRVFGADRIERWFDILRSGTTRARLAIVREMVEKMEPCEANAILKLYPGEEDRVRWGLIRTFGDLRIAAATPLIISDLKSAFHRECAIEALGKIGAGEAFGAIRDFVTENPESALIALLPLARTGKDKAIPLLRVYLEHSMAIMRQGAVKALAAIATQDCLEILKEQLAVEKDDKVRATMLQSTHYLEQLLFPPADRSEEETVVF
jgi:tRNA A-37 threonylcarbamoyl transferase component Bud32